jgi:RNase P subunit RPR2
MTMTDYKHVICSECKTSIWLPPALHEAALAAREKISWYCPYGHNQMFIKEKPRLQEDHREGNVIKLEKKL